MCIYIYKRERELGGWVGLNMWGFTRILRRLSVSAKTINPTTQNNKKSTFRKPPRDEADPRESLIPRKSATLLYIYIYIYI